MEIGLGALTVSTETCSHSRWPQAQDHIPTSVLRYAFGKVDSYGTLRNQTPAAAFLDPTGFNGDDFFEFLCPKHPPVLQNEGVLVAACAESVLGSA
eukprot:758727-Rhodomonas_salina.3